MRIKSMETCAKQKYKNDNLKYKPENIMTALAQLTAKIATHE